MKEYTFEEALDLLVGQKGSPARDEYDADMEEFRIGLAIRRAREARNLSQEELGKLVGVQKAQISRLEHGRNITISTLRRIFAAMNMPVKIDLGELGAYAIC